MLEAFNIFNHENYGSYTTTFSSAASYGKTVVQLCDLLTCRKHSAAGSPLHVLGTVTPTHLQP